MSLALVGLSHKSSPVSLRERLSALGGAEALGRLAARELPEAVVLSTCNRFEVYAAGSDGDSRALESKLAAGLSDLAGESAEVAEHCFYRRSDGAAVRHLFSVASGLESLVVGEAEILGQVKQAYEAARLSNRTGKVINVLFQRAIHVGKLVRSQTGISIGQSSVASVAVAMAGRIFGSLNSSRVLILGAGKMAELTAKHLLSVKVSRLYLSNRTREKALALAGQFQAEAVAWEDFPKLLDSVDIVISSTGAVRPILTRAMVADAAGRRQGRSLFIIDIAMPRDVEEGVHELDRVYLYTIEDLSGIVRENLSRRQAEISAAEVLVDGKAAEFWTWLSSIASGVRTGLRHSIRPSSLPPSLAGEG